MSKKKSLDKVELTEIELDLLNGWLAQQENIRIKAQQALSELQTKIDALPGEGRELKAEEGKVYKAPKE